MTWRECPPRIFAWRHIKKVWEVDLLVCGKCNGEMRIISFIYERALIKKILVQQRAPPAPAEITRLTDIVEYEPYDDGWPGYEEPSADVKSL